MTKAETLRAREVYRYYQPRDLTGHAIHTPQSSSSHESSDLDSQSNNVLKGTNYKTQQSFSDTALTAFAQLIALRLDCQRAIVSLSDHENEYFLAESTSTLSLLDENGPAQNAWLSIQGARVRCEQSLCKETLRLVSNQNSREEMTPWDVVPDLQLNARLRALDCVQDAPLLRFYAGVPLTNKNSINIGCVYVVDDRPRADITLDQAQFLTRMAATVMDHLENIRAKEDIVRVTKMSQALHAFIEGDGTMHGDWQRLKEYTLPAKGGVGFRWETNKDDGSGSYFDGKKHLGSDQSNKSSSNPRDTTSSVTSPLQHTENNSDARFNFNNSPWSSTSATAQIPPLISILDDKETAKAALIGGRDAQFSNGGFSILLNSVFSRASNLIREGMEVDGAVFFDAPSHFYQNRSTLDFRQDVQQPVRNQFLGSGDSSSQDHISDIRPGPNPRVLPAELTSDILGFSTQVSSSLEKSTSDSTFTAIDQSLLASLVRKYPQGELFVFDQDGPVTHAVDAFIPNDSRETVVPLTIEKSYERAEILRLWANFPGARQIFFIPLYDSVSGSFISSLAWSTSATRIFSVDNHLSYLIAFGHNVMSEVSRLNLLSADSARFAFISNVSHELRSPLHGILASGEFLADTDLDGFQRNLVSTIDICSRTLLSTIEHILDFSKINKFGQQNMQPMGVVSELDISAAIEEVIEGVFAGFEFNGLSSQGLADTTNSRNQEPSATIGRKNSFQPDTVVNVPPIIVIDIDFREQWKFPAVSGIWRRLMMNLFGNALKHTTTGYIKIKLQTRAIAPVTLNPNSDNIKRTMVILTVKDSGRGMSSDFMKTKLFMPFSQEDATLPGTGLGMSIVKQIVDLSGGKINVCSEQGKGTEIKLSLPLENVLPVTERTPSILRPTLIEDEVALVRRRTQGRTVNIQGFNTFPHQTSTQKEGIMSLKSSIEKYCTEWFNLKLVHKDEPADIAISDESVYMDSSISGRNFPILLILCSNRSRRDMDSLRLDGGQIVEFVSKPCGPHRLCRVLLNCLDTELLTIPVKGVSIDRTDLEQNTHPEKPTEESKARLIGALQSPIKFSPTSSVDMIKLALEDSQVQTTVKARRPKLSHTVSSTLRSSVKKPYMLLVEDNPVNMMLLATYMKKNKWDFEKANNGLEALQAFRNRPEGFDVIFMDVSMPIMNGYDSTRQIRAVESTRRSRVKLQRSKPSSPLSSFPFLAPPSPLSSPSPSPSPMELDYRVTEGLAIESDPALIIALTGFSSQKDQEMAFLAGVDIFMTKPVRFREVGTILEGWMGKRRAQEDNAT